MRKHLILLILLQSLINQIHTNILDNIFSQTLSPTVIDFQQSMHISQSVTTPEGQTYNVDLDLNVELGAITIEVAKKFGIGFISFQAPVGQIQIIPEHKNGSVSIPLGGICNNYQLVSDSQFSDQKADGQIQTNEKQGQKQKSKENLNKQQEKQIEKANKPKEKPKTIKEICMEEFEKWKSIPIEQCVQKQQKKKQQRQKAIKAEKVGFGDFLYFAFKFIDRTRQGYAIQQLRLDIYSDTTQRIREVQQIRGRGKQFEQLEKSLRPVFVLGNNGKIIRAYQNRQMNKQLKFKATSEVSQYQVCQGQIRKISQKELSNIWKDDLKQQFGKRYDQDDIPEQFRRIINFDDNN